MPLPRGTRGPGIEEGEVVVVVVVVVVSSGEYLFGVVGNIGRCRGLLSRLLKYISIISDNFYFTARELRARTNKPSSG